MEIKELGNSTAIEVSRDEAMDIITKALLKTKKDFTVKSNLPYSIRMEVLYVPKQTKKTINAWKKRLEESKLINFYEIIEEFRTTASGSSAKAVSQFCNVFSSLRNRPDISLFEMIEVPAEKNLMKFNRIGKNGVALFEAFLKTKGFRFAVWNGKEYV